MSASVLPVSISNPAGPNPHSPVVVVFPRAHGVPASATWVKTCFGGVWCYASSELTTAISTAPQRSRVYHAYAGTLSPPSPADVRVTRTPVIMIMIINTYVHVHVIFPVRKPRDIRGAALPEAAPCPSPGGTPAASAFRRAAHAFRRAAEAPGPGVGFGFFE